MPARIEALSLAAGLPREAAHSQLAAALDVVIHLGRGRDGRRRVLELGLPERLVWRQPFPGPGLAIRIVGGEATKERLEILREADAIARELA